MDVNYVNLLCIVQECEWMRVIVEYFVQDRAVIQSYFSPCRQPPFRPNRDLSTICQKLWNSDENYLTPGVDYKIDPQGYTFYSNMGQTDRAKKPLFEWVTEEALEKPTYQCKMANFQTWNFIFGKGRPFSF